MLAQPRRGIAELAGDVITYSGPAALVALLLSMLVAILLARSIAKPIARLAAGTAAMAKGEYNQRIPVGGTR